jgi:hypothetical protein
MKLLLVQLLTFAACADLLIAQNLHEQVQETLRTSGLEGLKAAVQNQAILWPRLTPTSKDSAVATVTFDALVKDHALRKPSEASIFLYAQLAAVFRKADGWSNRILADTATRFALDLTLRLSNSDAFSADFIGRLRASLPMHLLRGSERIHDLMVENGVDAQAAKNRESENVVLSELHLKSVYELWYVEAVLHLTARDLLSRQEASAFAARLSQTEIFLVGILPMLEAYLARGGKMDQLQITKWEEYDQIMKTAPKFTSEWFVNFDIQQLMAVLKPYRQPGFPNPVLREFSSPVLKVGP